MTPGFDTKLNYHLSTLNHLNYSITNGQPVDLNLFKFSMDLQVFHGLPCTLFQARLVSKGSMSMMRKSKLARILN